MPQAAAQAEREIFAGSIVSIGRVRCPVDDASFRQPSVVTGYRFVFPRNAVWIRTARARTYVSDPSVVEYYNDGDEVSRAPLDPRGDATEWYAVPASAAREIVRRHDPAAADAVHPFCIVRGPTDPGMYALQRALFQRALAGRSTDILDLEERVLHILDRVLARAYGARQVSSARGVSRSEREIATRASVVLSRMTRRRAALATIAREAGTSVFHLSRVFRRVTGRTLASHHLQLRLLASLEPLVESTAPLSMIATDHGFAGHSHYTSLFHGLFGVTPSAYRRSSVPAQREAVLRAGL